MSNNIYDTANQLERDFRDLEAFKGLEAAVAAIEEDSEASQLFKDFRQTSIKLQDKQMAGEELSEEERADVEALSVNIGQNELIQKMMQYEQQVSQVIEDLNRIITRPLNDLYNQIDN